MLPKAYLKSKWVSEKLAALVCSTLFFGSIIFLMIIFFSDDMIDFNSNLLIYHYYIGFAL
jgi:hypothetical protein